jgi:hypothetical protein
MKRLMPTTVALKSSGDVSQRLCSPKREPLSASVLRAARVSFAPFPRETGRGGTRYL